MTRTYLPTQAIASLANAAYKKGTGLCSVAATLLLLATPALSAPTLPEPTDLQQSNVTRLLLLNECMGCALSGANLQEAHLIGVDLRNANLQYANLEGSNLEGADLAGANLTGANLSNAFLTNTSLANAQLDGVDFSGAHLYYVDVTGASTNNLTLTGAELLETPIYVGGEEDLFIPFEELDPTESYEQFLDPIL